jgi:hypothetical protein
VSEQQLHIKNIWAVKMLARSARRADTSRQWAPIECVPFHDDDDVDENQFVSTERVKRVLEERSPYEEIFEAAVSVVSGYRQAMSITGSAKVSGLIRANLFAAHSSRIPLDDFEATYGAGTTNPWDAEKVFIGAYNAHVNMLNGVVMPLLSGYAGIVEQFAASAEKFVAANPVRSADAIGIVATDTDETSRSTREAILAASELATLGGSAHGTALLGRTLELIGLCGEERSTPPAVGSIASIVAFLRAAKEVVRPALTLDSSGHLYLTWKSSESLLSLKFLSDGIIEYSFIGFDVSRPPIATRIFGRGSGDTVRAILRLVHQSFIKA